MRIKKSGNFEEEIQKIDEQIEKYMNRINQLKAAKQEYMERIEKEKIEEIKEMMAEMGIGIDDIKKMLQKDKTA